MSQTREPEELPTGEKLEGQELRHVAFVREQNNRILVDDDDNRSALWRLKRSSTSCMASEHLFLACTKGLRDFGLGERPCWQCFSNERYGCRNG